MNSPRSANTRSESAVGAIEYRRKRLVSIRLTQTEIAQIERAARRCGVSPAEFVREAAVSAAKEGGLWRPAIRLSAKSFAGFMAQISSTAAPVPEIVERFRRSAPWEFERIRPYAKLVD